MADTGAPWNIPYVENADLVKDYPAASLALANAIDAGLDAAAGLVQTAYAVKTDAFSASVAAGALTEITDLSVSITPTDAANTLIVLAMISGSQALNGAAVYALYRDGSITSLVGDAASNRGRRTTGGGQNVSDSVSSISIVGSFTAGSTSATTFSVYVGHGRASSDTVYVNRSNTDSDVNYFYRTASSILVLEVKV